MILVLGIIIARLKQEAERVMQDIADTAGPDAGTFFDGRKAAVVKVEKTRAGR